NSYCTQNGATDRPQHGASAIQNGASSGPKMGRGVVPTGGSVVIPTGGYEPDSVTRPIEPDSYTHTAASPMQRPPTVFLPQRSFARDKLSGSVLEALAAFKGLAASE